MNYEISMACNIYAAGVRVLDVFRDMGFFTCDENRAAGCTTKAVTAISKCDRDGQRDIYKTWELGQEHVKYVTRHASPLMIHHIALN